MSQFEFFMTFYGLLLGLGVAELLSGFANILRAPVRPKLGLLTPILAAQYLIQIMTTFFDAFVKLQNVGADFAGFALPTVIGMAFFAGAVMVVPRRAEDWASLDAYFFHQRRWTVGATLLAFFATVLIELPSVWSFVAAGDWPRFTFYAVMNGVLLASLLVPLFARSRFVIAGSLIFTAVFLVYLYSPIAFRPFAAG